MKHKLVKIIVKDNKEFIEFENGVILGQVYQEVDGYYVFVPNPTNGFWEAYILRAIADMLDKKNEKWHKQVMKDLQSKEK
jgi:predicted secreted acid phosphatase